MQQVEASAEVPASADEIFAYVAEPANLPAWMSGIVSAEQTTLGPMGVGTTARVVRELMGQRFAADLKVTSFDPPRRLGLTTTVQGIRADASLDLVPHEAGAGLRFAMQIAAANVFMKPLEGIVAQAAQQDVAESLTRLAKVFANR